MNETFDFRREYEPSAIAQRVARIPRFGYPSDITLLFSEDSSTGDSKKDYVVGLIIAASLIIAAFLLWSVLLLFFKCRGPGRYGFLAGAPFQEPLPTDDPRNNDITEEYSPQTDTTRRSNSEESSSSSGNDPSDDMSSLSGSGFAAVHPSLYSSQRLEGWIDEGMRSDEVPSTPPSDVVKSYSKTQSSSSSTNRSCCRASRSTHIRIAFILSGIIFIVFTILLFTLGVANLQSTVDTLNGSAQDIDTLALEGQDILNSGIKSVRNKAVAARDLVVEELRESNFCPNDPALDTNSDVGRQVREMANNAVVLLEQLDDFVASQVDEAEAVAQDVHEFASKAVSTTDKIELTAWWAIFTLFVCLLVPCLLILGVIMAFREMYVPTFGCVLKWVVLPLFILMVLASWVTSTGMIMAAGINGDFCLPGGRANGSPDDSVLTILELQGFSQDTFVGQAVQYYVEQCTVGEDPFQFLHDYLPELEKNEQAIDQLGDALGDDTVVAELSEYCGRDLTEVATALRDMREILAIVLDAMSRALDMVRCDRIVPIYTTTAYDAMCTYSVSAVYWVFASALILGIFGMLMITFRSAFKPTEYYDDEDDDDDDESQDYDLALVLDERTEGYHVE